MDKDALGARSTMTSVKGSAKGSPRSSILAELTPKKSYSTKPSVLFAERAQRAKTGMDNMELDFDSCYKYPIKVSNSATKRAGSTFKDRDGNR